MLKPTSPRAAAPCDPALTSSPTSLPSISSETQVNRIWLASSLSPCPGAFSGVPRCLSPLPYCHPSPHQHSSFFGISHLPWTMNTLKARLGPAHRSATVPSALRGMPLRLRGLGGPRGCFQWLSW